MLVYGPGQFFVPHQDSEKSDDMIGSLVITLPGTFSGGILEVEHRGEHARYRGSKNSLSLVAFYADCKHQVQPVRSGHRIVLTHDLVRSGDAGGIEASGADVGALSQCLEEHFTGQGGSAPPNRLVYLLEHEYTERALDWSRLKGNDAWRATALCEAATQTDCEVVLGLADVNEVWSAFERDPYRRRYGRSRRWDDDEDENDDDDWADDAGGDAEDYELEELVDWSTTLKAWVDAPGKPAEPISLRLNDAEVCATVPSVDLAPYSSEYEGYMGNYGNTLDRWYHRGAVVVWPRQQSFVARAEAAPNRALSALRDHIRRGERAKAQEMAATLRPFWRQVAAGIPSRRFFTTALGIAADLGDAATATMLLDPFRLDMLTASDAHAVCALIQRYGEQWFADLLAGWSQRPTAASSWRPSENEEWLARLGSLTAALDQRGENGRAGALLVISDVWTRLANAVDQHRATRTPSRREAALADPAAPIVAVLHSAADIGATEQRDRIIAFLCDGSEDLLPCAMAVLRAAERLPASTRTTMRIEDVGRYGADWLAARLARPVRSVGDWSIQPPTGCACALCHKLATFLADSGTRMLEWPIKQDDRRHVHIVIDATEFPVRHQTRRKGRPYTLVLTKSDELFQREQRTRQRDQNDLALARRLTSRHRAKQA
jgi:2OG-Fe(II) oxygenase superfamily